MRSAPRTLVVLLTLVPTMIISASLAGCGGVPVRPTDTSSLATAPTSSRVAFLFPFDDEFYVRVRLAFQARASQYGMTFESVYTENDVATESAAVDRMIEKKLGAIIMQPVSDESVAAMRRARAAGIPVICYGNCVGEAADPDVVTGVVQSDSTGLGSATGEAAARSIKDRLEGRASQGGTLGATHAVAKTSGNAVVFGTDMSTDIADELLRARGPLQAATGQDTVGIGKQTMDLARLATRGEPITTFDSALPGTFYDRADPEKISVYLEAAGS